jgi:hypothetical protein
MANRRERIDMRIWPDDGPTCDNRVGYHTDAVFQHDIGANAAKRANKNIFAKLGAVFDNRSGMNITHMAVPTP